jgi:hypothetical protein
VALLGTTAACEHDLVTVVVERHTVPMLRPHLSANNAGAAAVKQAGGQALQALDHSGQRERRQAAVRMKRDPQALRALRHSVRPRREEMVDLRGGMLQQRLWQGVVPHSSSHGIHARARAA